MDAARIGARSRDTLGDMRSMRPRASTVAVVVGAALGASAPACTDPVYACNADDQCVSGDALGICEETGFCSFPDEACDSGRRYGAHAGDLAHDCVPPVDEDTTGSGPSTLDDGDPSEAGPGEASGPADTTTTTAPDPTDGTDASASTGTTDADSGTTDDTSTPTCDPFHDDFERPDAPEIGNGWIEKHPLAFELAAGRVDFESDTWSYPNNVVYRPFDESVLDVEVSIEVVFDVASPPEHPQVHVRVQEDVIDVDGAIHSYVVFIEDDNGIALAIARVSPTGGFGAYAEMLLPEPIEVGPEYRLRGRVLGTDPVVVDGTWERLVDDAWVTITEVQLVDDGDGRIADAGTVGFSGHGVLDNYTYDDFVRQEICP